MDVAEVSSAPGVPSPSGLYPQPQQGGALTAPQALDLIGNISRNAMLMKELQGRQAIGEAYQGAINPDGTLDPQKWAAGIKSRSAAAWGLQEAIGQLTNQQNSQFNLTSGRQQLLRQIIGGMSDNPSKEELNNGLTTAVRGGIPLMEAFEAFEALKNSPNRAAAVSQFRNMGLTPAEQSSRVQGEPGIGGAPQSTTTANANRAGTVTTGLPAYAGPSIEAKTRDQTAMSNYSTDVEPIRQSLDIVEELRKKYGEGFLGEGTETRNRWKSAIQAVSPSLAKTLGIDVDTVADYDKLKKYLTNVTMSRATSFGAHSDQQLATAASGTPNVKVTDLAVPDLLRMQLALKRSEYAQVQQSVARGGNAGEEYLNEKSKWPSQNDPRAFMIDLLSPEDRSKLISSMPKGSAELKRFNNSLRAGYESGVLSRPTKTSPASPPVKPGKQSQAEPPIAGARLAADGHWYVKQPHENGDYQRVVMNA